jgi:mRNA interferase MazF
MEILRGEVWLVDFDPSKAEDAVKTGSEIMRKRPAVIVSATAINRVRRTVVVVPLSTAQTPVEIFAVPVPSAGELSVAVCDQVTAVFKATRLVRRITKLSAQDLRAIESGLRDCLEIN